MRIVASVVYLPPGYVVDIVLNSDERTPVAILGQAFRALVRDMDDRAETVLLVTPTGSTPALEGTPIAARTLRRCAPSPRDRAADSGNVAHTTTIT